MKQKKLNPAGRVFLTILALASTAKASSGVGVLNIINSVNSPYSSYEHKTIHKPGASEGFNNKDLPYNPYLYPDLGTIAKIVSIVEDKELEGDARPEESLTPINSELSIHKEYAPRGDPVSIDSENELWIGLPFAGAPYFYDFGKKPITFWEREIIDPNENPNEPNNYTISFLADVREAIDKSDFYPGGIKTAKLILPHLDGIRGSEIPYIYTQTRFNTFPGDFTLDGKVNLKDFAYWAVCDPIADITGENGLPDGKVDFHDFGLYLRDYLKDSNDPNTW